jgi:flagellar hook-associated protein 3 FlgL
MRMSTAGLHHNALTSMLAQQATLSKTQNQVATGKRVQTPADDPVAAVHIMELQRSLQETEQFGRNADRAANRLTLEEQALAEVNTLLQRVHEQALQANNSTIDAAGRRLIATEVRGRLEELIGIANGRDAGGEYLFAGYATLTQPFAQTGSAVAYFGDQGSRQLQISPTQRVSDSNSGFEVFMNVTEGNGVFVMDAAGGNTGTGVIGGGSVADLSQWVPDDYTLRFTSATGNYEIVDSAANVITTGVYTQNGTISFRGINVNMTGMPANADSFSISRSRTEDIFSTINDLVGALESSNTETQAGRAQFNTDMARLLQQLDQTQDHLLNVRAQVGTRLSSLDAAEAAREDRKVELQAMTSELRDLDYAEAISRMNQQLMGLEAAQASYSRISQLSLFDYLR